MKAQSANLAHRHTHYSEPSSRLCERLSKLISTSRMICKVRKDCPHIIKHAVGWTEGLLEGLCEGPEGNKVGVCEGSLGAMVDLEGRLDGSVVGASTWVPTKAVVSKSITNLDKTHRILQTSAFTTLVFAIVLYCNVMSMSQEDQKRNCIFHRLTMEYAPTASPSKRTQKPRCFRRI